MKLSVWVAREMKKKPVRSKTTVLKALAEKSKVSLLTLQNVERGGVFVLYPKATAVSKATGGKVKPVEMLGGDS